MRETRGHGDAETRRQEDRGRAMVLSADCAGRVRACALTPERLRALDWNADSLALLRGDLTWEQFGEEWQ